MTTVVQNYVGEFGLNVTNGFDIHTWQTATSVENICVRVVVKQGRCDFRLQLISGEETSDLWSRDFEGPGQSVSPEFELSELEGIVMPVLQNASDDLDFEVSFETTSEPILPSPYINYIACTFKRAAYIQNNSRVFLKAIEKFSLSDIAHLTVVDNGGDSGVSACGNVTVFQNKNTGGSGGFGRGMYESCHGELKDKNFTHVCLMDDDIYLHPEMFFRNHQLVRFLKPGHHIGAPMYPTSSEQKIPRTSSCFGHRFLATHNPTDHAIGSGLDTREIGSFVSIERTPDSTGWWWNCISLEDIQRAGLPYPFFIKMDDVEYSLRLGELGTRLVIPLSFWVLHDDFDEKYSASMQYYRTRNRLVLLSQQSDFDFSIASRWEFYTSVVRFVRRRQYERAELTLQAFADFFRGPEFLINQESEILSKVFKTTQNEKNSPTSLDSENTVVSNRTYTSGSLKNILEFISLNFHFVPMKRKDITIDTTRMYTVRDCWNGQSITYWNSLKRVAYTVKTDSSRAAKIFAKTILRAVKPIDANRISEAYRDQKPYFTSAEFWRGYGKHTELAAAKSKNGERPAGRTLPADLVGTPKVMKGVQVDDRDHIFLNTIRNTHLGKRCFIIGNGPSLKTEDLDRLVNEYTFASNKIYLAFDQTIWRPTFYSVEDVLVAKNNAERIAALTESTKIFPHHMLKYIPRQHNHFYTRWLPPKDNRSSERHFSTDLAVGLCWGSTVTYSLMQMAVHMGFKEIYLLGIDHSYVESKVKENSVLVSSGEVNHFHPDYRKPGEKWHLPVLDRLECSYQYAASFCDSIGVKVYNASRRTELRAFPRVSFDEILGNR